jgi:hypothetical protein
VSGIIYGGGREIWRRSSAGFARAIDVGEVWEGAIWAPSEPSGMGEHIVVVYGREAS